MTCINCILKLTALPTEVNVKLPGAGRGLGAFTSSAVCLELTGFLLFSWGKAPVHLRERVRSKRSLKAICPLGHQFPAQSYQDNGGLARSQGLENKRGGLRESRNPRKIRRFQLYSLIHVQQGPRALAQGDAPNGCSGAASLGRATQRSSSGRAGCTTSLRNLARVQQTLRFQAEGKFHVPPRFYLTHLPEKPNGFKMIISFIYIYTYLCIYIHACVHTYLSIYIYI